MIDVIELRIGNVVNDDTNLAQDIGCKVVGIVESISDENIGLKYLRSENKDADLAMGTLPGV